MKTFSAISELIRKKRTILLVLCAAVVFVTTYLLVLPAMTLDEQEAADQGGIDLPTQLQQEEIGSDDSLTQPQQKDGEDVISLTQPQKEDKEDIVSPTQLQQELDDVSVSAVFDAKAGLPEDTELAVSALDSDEETCDALREEALLALQAEDGGEAVTDLGPASFYDITLLSEGQPVEPDSAVDVTISFNKGLTVSDAQNLRIVHFGEKKTEILDPQDTAFVLKKGKLQETSFSAESFSIYGVITVPDPNGVNDLAGRSFTMNLGGRYITSTVVSDTVNKLGKTNQANQAAEWTFEQTEEPGKYRIYTLVGGEKRYITMTRRDANNAHAGLSSDSGSVFTVTDSGQGTYVFSAVSNGTTYYLNEFGGAGGNGFAGWHQRNQNNDRITVTYTQPVQNEYAVIVHVNDQYYAVQNDGSLALVEGYSPETGTIRTVDLNETTMMWSYDSIASIVGNGSGYVLRHRSDAHAFDSVGLPIGFNYTYIDVNSGNGLTTTRDGHNWWEAGNYQNVTRNASITYDENNHRLAGVGAGSGHYIGITDDNGTLRITGTPNAGNAAEIYLAKAVNINPASIRNSTVNHIDISVYGTANITVPLAYGEYRLARVDDEGNIIGYRDQNLIVTRENQADATAERIVPVTPQDIKTGDFSAYTLYKGYKEELDDVFYVTGYTGNAQGSNETPQVRIEGSFKVSDVDPVPLNENENSDRIRNERLDKPIYYNLSITKDVEFTLTYVDEDDPARPTYVVIKEGEPFTVTVPSTLSNTFTYWDEENECPGIDVAQGGRDAWRRGEIHENTDWWSGGDARPGMDFRLGTPNDDTNHDIVAIEVTKFVQGDFGDEVRTLELRDGTTCNVDVYQNNSTTPKHDKSISVGKDGIGMMHDYDIIAGTYADPAYVQISEDPDSVADEVYDDGGNKWIYQRSRVETEFVYRNDAVPYQHPDRYVSRDYTKADGAYMSASEVIGEYSVPNGIPYDYNGVHYDGVHEYNRFEEFYVYNIYKRAGYLNVNKMVLFNGQAPSSASEKQALAGTYTFTVYTNEECTEPYMVDIVPKPATGPQQEPLTLEVTIGEDGAAKNSETVELPTGIYWVKETMPDNGAVPVNNVVRVPVGEETTEDDPATAEFENNITTAMDINVLKVDGDSAPLAGAKFILRQYEDDTYRNVVRTFDEQEVGSTGDAKGKLKFEQLTDGYYELVESVVPKGYVMTGDAPRFVVVFDPEDKVLKVRFTNTDTVTYSEANNTFTVENEPGAELPSAGGPGTTWIYLLGSIMLLCCGVTLIARGRTRMTSRLE